MSGPEQLLILCPILQLSERHYKRLTCLPLLAPFHSTGDSSKSQSQELASIEIPSPPKEGTPPVDAVGSQCLSNHPAFLQALPPLPPKALGYFKEARDDQSLLCPTGQIAWNIRCHLAVQI